MRIDRETKQKKYSSAHNNKMPTEREYWMRKMVRITYKMEQNAGISIKYTYLQRYWD